MGTDDFHHKNKRQRTGNYGRPSGNKRDKRETFLIVCEGEATEPNYFKAFPVKSNVIDLDVRGEGKNTLSLVREAVRLQEEAIDRQKPYVQVWCVFDKDSFINKHFNQAIQLCITKRIRYAYTNEAFELWYLLHFDYMDAAHSRDQYKGKLTIRIGHEYRKEDPLMYSLLQELGNEKQAIQWAEDLRKYHFERDGKHDPYNQNPSTTVHKLVEILNKYAEDREERTSHT